MLHSFCQYNYNDRQLTLSRDYIDTMPNDRYLETKDQEPSERTSAHARNRIKKALFQYWLDNVK